MSSEQNKQKNVNPNNPAPDPQQRSRNNDTPPDDDRNILLTTFTYEDHNGIENVIFGAISNAVRGMLPRRLPTLLPPFNPPAYELRDIPGKGKGMIATRDIALGEIVIVERPVTIYETFIDLESLNGFEQYVKMFMNPEIWKAYNNLCNVKGDSISHFRGVCNTNAFEVDIDFFGKHNSYGAVFLELSRLNHSCGPNLDRLWDSHLFVFTVQAVRPIRAGQELTVGYENICEPHAFRRSELERKYKFDCACGYCTNTSPASDQVRFINRGQTLISKLDKPYKNLLGSFLTAQVGYQRTNAHMNDLIANLVVITKEGIEATASFWHYVWLMNVSGLLGDKKRFRQWGFKAVLFSMNFSNTSEFARREIEKWISWIKEPETFPYWGARSLTRYAVFQDENMAYMVL